MIGRLAKLELMRSNLPNIADLLPINEFKLAEMSPEEKSDLLEEVTVLNVKAFDDFVNSYSRLTHYFDEDISEEIKHQIDMRGLLVSKFREHATLAGHTGLVDSNCENCAEIASEIGPAMYDAASGMISSLDKQIRRVADRIGRPM